MPSLPRTRRRSAKSFQLVHLGEQAVQADLARIGLQLTQHPAATSAFVPLADAPAYRVVPGLELSGALTVSCFAVADEIEAQDDHEHRYGRHPRARRPRRYPSPRLTLFRDRSSGAGCSFPRSSSRATHPPTLWLRTASGELGLPGLDGALGHQMRTRQLRSARCHGTEKP